MKTTVFILLSAFLSSLPDKAAAQNTMSSDMGETLPPLRDGTAPETYDELWAGFDPRKEPLDVEVLHEWEQEGTVLKVIRYRVGIFKGKKAMMAAVYGYPKGAKRVPGLVQIHGGGGWGTDVSVLANATAGYATISIAWDGRIRTSKYSIDDEAKQLFWDGKKDNPKYRPTTDWGDLAGFFYPRPYDKKQAREHRLDPIESPRNVNWFYWTIGARRAITFLEQQPEVDGQRIGVYGHSMGGELTVAVAGSDSRVKAASPSCGGITFNAPHELLNCRHSHKRISCPILFVMQANDFAGRFYGLTPAVKRLQSKQWRVVSEPHLAHKGHPSYFVSATLFFNHCLKNEFRMPENPVTALDFETGNNTPVFSVAPDASQQILSVDIYYTLQDMEGRTIKTDRDGAVTKYWQYAPATESNGTWTAPLPLYSVDRELWVYADIHYAYDREIQYNCGGPLYKHNSFHLASLPLMITPDELKAAGVKANLKHGLVIEDFQGDWEKEWFVARAGTKTSYKLRAPLYQPPSSDSKLSIEVQSDKTGNMKIDLQLQAVRQNRSYTHLMSLQGDSKWQQAIMGLSDFADKHGETLNTWDNLTRHILLPPGWDWQDLTMRDLKWIENE